ncbi:hypothetical protein CVT24_004319 [Panaeolus cyanescens]|uniref:DUF7721 domain-containing protein n=1 Tax=Panaeolus cyanescens TaxID=181874 RepID=A0A409VEM6_9AGAR|nr:hypothetical protein CVT24_004319 [Panaeolus cyanescens]
MSSTKNFDSAPQHSAVETTAAQATAEAPNLRIAQEIKYNAEEEQNVAGQAARIAQGLGKDYTGEVSTDQTVAAHEAKLQAERKALDAVEEGKRDVDQAKTAASGYMEVAKEYVNSAIETAQHYLPTAIGGKPTQADTTGSSVHPSSGTGHGVVDSVRETASAAYTTAVETVQPVVEKVKSSAEGALGATGLQGKNVADRTHDSNVSTGLGSKDAASTAPLQSGDKVVKGPYAEGVPSHEIGTNAPTTQDVSKTGGEEYNSPHHSGHNSATRPDIDDSEAIRNAKAHSSQQDTSLFETALGFLNSNKSKHEEPLDEDDVTRAHHKAYNEGNTSGLSANALGGAAALQVLKQFTSGSGSSSRGGSSQTQLISLAMAEATKLFDKSGGNASGNKQDAVNGAAMTVMKLLVQSKFGGGTTGGSDSGGLGGLLNLVRYCCSSLF